MYYFFFLDFGIYGGHLLFRYYSIIIIIIIIINYLFLNIIL